MSSRERKYGPKISIHALREESDSFVEFFGCELAISIHALREESDDSHHEEGDYLNISIHALREESDAPCWKTLPPEAYFNPRSP